MLKHAEIRMRRQDFVFAVVAIFLLGAIIGISFLPKPQQKVQDIPAVSEASVEVGIPAVDTQGNGIVGTLITVVKPGTGRILVNVDNVFSQVDTQFSSRTAVKAAADYMKIDPKSIDVIFTLKVNATLVEGPSAGSSMAASVVLALSNITADRRVMMTGTIEENGSIGAVGAIAEKASAAKENGAEIFIVPPGQSTDVSSRKESKCELLGSVRVCTITYLKEKVNISSSLNMTIAEAKDLGEIMEIYRGFSQE